MEATTESRAGVTISDFLQILYKGSEEKLL